MNTTKRITLVAMLGVLLSFAPSTAHAAVVTLADPASPTCERVDPSSDFYNYDCTVALPETFEFVTTNPNFRTTGCGHDGGEDECDATWTTTGPDGTGNYHHTVRVPAAPLGTGNGFVFKSWSTNPNNADWGGVSMDVTDNGIDPFGELVYDIRDTNLAQGQCRVTTSLSYYMLEQHVQKAIITIQRRKQGKWRTLVRKPSGGIGLGRYTKRVLSNTASVSRSELGRRNRTVINQKVQGHPTDTTVYHRVAETKPLSKRCT